MNRKTWAVFFGVALALGCIDLSGFDAMREARRTGDAIAAATLGALSNRLGFVVDWLGEIDGYHAVIVENKRLRDENRLLMQVRDETDLLKHKVASYQRLLNLPHDTGLRKVSGRLVGTQRSPLGERINILNVGADHGVAVGDAIVDGRGLIGRVVEIFPTFSHFLALNETKSRIPISIGDNNLQGILIGDGARRPKLGFSLSSEGVKDGQIVVTSGRSDLLPAGIPVGIVARDVLADPLNRFGNLNILDEVESKIVWRVQLFSDIRSLDYVRALGVTPIEIADRTASDNRDDVEIGPSEPTALLTANP